MLEKSRSSVGALRPLLSDSKWLLACALIASVVSGLGSVQIIAVINRGISGESAQLRTLAWQFAGWTILVVVTRTLGQQLFTQLSQGTLARLRQQISRRFANAAYDVIERHGAVRGLAVLTEDVNTVAQLLVALPILILNGVTVLGCLGYLAYLSTQVFLIALATLGIGAIGYHLAQLRGIDFLRRARADEDELHRHFRALFDGAKELRLHRRRREEFLAGTLDATIERVRAQRIKGLTLYNIIGTWGTALTFAFIGVVLFLLAPAFGVSQSVSSGYALVFLFMLLPIEAVLQALPVLGRASVSLDRIRATTSSLDSDPAGSSGSKRPPSRRTIALLAVTHRYFREADNECFQLGPLDLELNSGEIVFLVGGNGSGKTTLAKLLVGLYRPESGEVMLDGKALGVSDLVDYREQFAAVFADFFLFDRLLGMSAASAREFATTLLTDLQLSHKVSITDGRFSTLQLSQGQRKRLALLVAFLEDRPFYLFDEWAADQDPIFKDVFYTQLLPRLKALGKGVLVVSHDDRYFHTADRVIKLENGKILTLQTAGAAVMKAAH